MKIFQKICLIFTLVGAINWGLIGLLDFNLVSALFSNEMIQNIIYIIVGVCGCINIYLLFSDMLLEKD